MGTKRLLGRNVVWNTAGLVVETATGFLVLPFLLTRLGSSTYGVWLVLGALTSYFGLLELGVRGSIGRHIALYHSKGDQTAVNQTLTVGVGVLLLLGSGAFVALILCEPLFFRIYEIPASDRESVSLAFRLIAANFVIFLVGVAFDATLWGFQRFDWLNVIDIPVSLLRGGLIFALIRSSGDLVVLAYITLGLSATSGGCKALLSFRANPQLRLGLRFLDRSSLRQVLGYGSWNVISTLAKLSRAQFALLLLGAILGLGFVPFVAVANRLLGAVAALMAAVTGVLTPHATALHANSQTASQQHLFLVGGRYSAVLSAFLLTLLLVLGGPLIALWVGPDFSEAASLLLILILGEWLPGTQYVTNAIILATARHRALALFATLEAIAVCALLAILTPLFGITGIGLAIALPALLARGVAPLIHGCRILGVPLRTYLMRAILPPLLCGTLPALAVRSGLAAYPIETWGMLLGYSAVYSLLFGMCYACLLDRRWLGKLSQRIWQRKRTSSPQTNTTTNRGDVDVALANVRVSGTHCQ